MRRDPMCDIHRHGGRAGGAVRGRRQWLDTKNVSPKCQMMGIYPRLSAHGRANGGGILLTYSHLVFIDINFGISPRAANLHHIGEICKVSIIFLDNFINYHRSFDKHTRNMERAFENVAFGGLSNRTVAV